MSYIPTLSRDLRDLIGTKWDEDEVVEKLKKDPRLLLKFLQQATQQLCRFRKHQSFLGERILREIKVCVINQSLPWECLSIGPRNVDSFLLQGCISWPDIHFENDSVRFSSLVMIRDCSNFREKWLGHPEFVPKASDIAHYISMSEAYELFRNMIEPNFELLHKHEMEKLQKYLLQAKEWGYQKGIIAIQEILCKYVGAITPIFELYLFSDAHQFDIIRQHCLTMIKECEFFETVDSEGRSCLVNYELYGDKNLSSEIGALDRKITSERLESFWKHEGKFEGVILKRLSFSFTGKSYTVRQSFLDAKDLTEKANLRSSPRVRLNDSMINQITIDGKNKPSDACIGGMIRYFKTCLNISLSAFLEVNTNQLLEISRGRSDIFSLLIEASTIKDIDCIPSLFPSLYALTIVHSSLTKEQFISIMNSNVTMLSLLCSKVELPENLNPLSRLEFFSFNRVRNLSKEELRRLFNILTKLNKLQIGDLKNFTLDMIAHPEHLVDLCIDSGILNDLNEADLNTFLSPFKKLKVLSIVGKLSPNVKGFFNERIRERRDISFNFLLSRV